METGQHNASLTLLEAEPQVWRYCSQDVFLLKVNEIVVYRVWNEKQCQFFE